MSEGSDERLHRALRAALRPMGGEEPRRDLWPRVAERLAAGPRVQVTRLDWALLAAAAAWLAFFPESVLGLLYHF
jgi:hypothetical protein